MTPSSNQDETASSPFEPSTEAEIANAFLLAMQLFQELERDLEQNPDEEA
jgi:hypothetical protein